MSSAAPAAAAVAPTSVAVAAAAPVLAPSSPFLASGPLVAAYGAPPPPGSPIQSRPHGETSGDLAPVAADAAAPPLYGAAPPPAYGATAPSPYGYYPYGAPPMAPGAPPLPPSSWPAFGAPPLHQPPAAPPSHPYGSSPLPPQHPYAAYPGPHGAAASYTGEVAASLQPSYGAAAAPQPHPPGAAVVPPYGAHAAGPPGFPALYPVSAAHTDPVAASSPFYFSHLLPVKLAPDNYLSWRAQVLPLLRSRYLEGYVDGSIPCPPPHHPAYHTWVAQDQAILSAIQSSLTPSVSSLVIFAATSREAWAALHTSFASQSQARAHSIRTELGEMKLGDLSITDYFNKMRGLADTLASVGQSLQDEEFTTFVLNGLDDDYDNLIENVHGRDDPLPPPELYARLLGREQRIKARRVSPGFASANAATRGKPPQSSSSGGKPAPSPQSASRGNAPSITGGNCPVACCSSCGAPQACQLCGLERHIASRCLVATSKISWASATMVKGTISRPPPP